MHIFKQGLIHRRAGFTLIELLVVIGIIGILSGIVLSSLQSSRKKAGDAAVIQEMNNLRTAMALHRDTTNNPYAITTHSPNCDGTNPQLKPLLTSLKNRVGANNIVCYETSGLGEARKAAVAAQLPSTVANSRSKWYCIDWKLAGHTNGTLTSKPEDNVINTSGPSYAYTCK